MKLAWFCIPAAGHTNPTLEVVRTLTEAGHHVRYYSFQAFREKLEAVGAEVVTIDDYCAEMKLGPDAGVRIAKDTAFATKVLADTTLAVDEALLDDLRAYGPEVIVADSMAMWGKLLAIKLGVPFVCSTTTFAFNQHSAKVMKQSLWDLVKLLLGMPKINRELKRLQDKGYAVKSILDVVQNDNDTNTVVYTSDYFQPCADTFSDKYAFVGPSVREAAPLPRTSDRKRVYISMGTVNNDMPALYRTCIAALADRYELILSVGKSVDPASLGELPPHVTAAQHVDQMAVLADCDAFLTHCGMNSVSEALYCGVPLVLFPQTAEQQGVANRTAELGAGVLLGRASADSIRAAVDKVITDSSFREEAAKIARSFREAGGAPKAAEAILRAAQ
ncbi:MAG: glucosyltransferase [Clostridiales bacterium]|nr:glucosyltransferase [Clostridiales bacterium]